MSKLVRQLGLSPRTLQSNLHPEALKLILGLADVVYGLQNDVKELAKIFDRLVDNQIVQASAFKELQKNSVTAKRLKEMGIEVGSDPSVTGDDYNA